ncbi:MAG: hypothetical protein LBB21_00440, partial [Holosporaceae bacterium]|nr:hypothetical protein [Holosporaceae bacterium]
SVSANKIIKIKKTTDASIDIEKKNMSNSLTGIANVKPLMEIIATCINKILSSAGNSTIDKALRSSFQSTAEAFSPPSNKKKLGILVSFQQVINTIISVYEKQKADVEQIVPDNISEKLYCYQWILGICKDFLDYYANGKSPNLGRKINEVLQTKSSQKQSTKSQMKEKNSKKKKKTKKSKSTFVVDEYDHGDAEGSDTSEINPVRY